MVEARTPAEMTRELHSWVMSFIEGGRIGMWRQDSNTGAWIFFDILHYGLWNAAIEMDTQSN